MEWTFDPVGGTWLAIAVAAALLITPWVVAPRGVALTPRRRAVLAGLRTAAVLLLIFAWWRPTVVRVRVEAIRPALLMLFDSSRSMGGEDALDGASRWDAALRMLGASDGALRRLSEQTDVRAFRFDRDLSPVPYADGRIDLPAAPDGGETTLGASLAEAIDQASGAPISGVVVVSDGAQRATPPRDLAPLAAAQRLAAEGAPLFAVPVGERSSGDRADVALDDLLVSDTAFAGAPLEASAALGVAGFPNREVRVRMLWENAEGRLEPVDTQTVAVRQGVDAYPITLRHTPTTPGEWKLTLRADPLEGETLTGNNETSTFVTVREGGVRVLYLAGATRVGGAPGLEQRFVRASLAASPDLVVERRVFDYRQPRADLAGRFAPGGADVVILDNLDSEALSRASWQALAERVQAGAGLAMLGGQQSFGPGGHAATPLADVLPVTLGRAERQPLDQPPRDDVHLPGPLRIVPTEPRGVRHPILQLSEENAAAWAGLPPLDGANRLDPNRLKPNAVVLAETDDATNNGADPRPLIVIGQPGLGRVLAFAGDTTWRWPLAGRGEAHRRFWRQAVLWLAKKDDDRSNPVYLELAARRVAPGARLDLTAGTRLSEEELDKPGAAPLRYEATVTSPDGAERPLPLPGGGDRVAGAFTATRQAGDYRVVVRASRGGQAIGEAQARFLVPERDVELERPGAEPDTLARLARATESAGGRTLALEELPELLAELARRPPEEKQEVTARTTLWDKWPVLILLVGLLSAEWFLRRRWGMP